MTRFKIVASLLTLLWLAGCSALSPYSSLTKLNLTLDASDQLNPDLNDRPSPIVLQLMALKHPVAFENSDFFSLYERAQDSLGDDLVAREELELRPGETRQLKLSLTRGSRYVAVLAAYRDLPETQWRYVIPVREQALNRATLKLERDGIRSVVETLARQGNGR
ncbi:type VI secretion system lipoprotein TssJ [Pseudomonas sp. SDI]|uniref:type VI secretion system lipoprotein TssJ n=1 Tax=Pseudomonas sp. SDI TaxID=2170734 RepID=UPI000DE6F8B3|nr:type VI secretion system lipoprotein TssJ [Pseudomonas sp. SDI]PWB31963.1 type VI secretion system lipoprotein TssJ [Pseudomonas sp. SDI]